MRRRLTEVTLRRLEGSVLDLEREKSDLTKLSVLKADPHLHRPSVSWKSTAQSSEHINLGRNREDEGNEKTRWGKKVTPLAPMSKQSKLEVRPVLLKSGQYASREEAVEEMKDCRSKGHPWY
ncbi:hypothetical protein F2Q69_00029250 [Brassica cretica]|uniref:Uncharacterized protein n=1 Tax=Brassica cretica TaxID=69181 RepID=A0A8S9RSI4_BRACR|nr:hypothetical protein F2Q69_00029250 [Brassica cretica]